jgi:hypothetical protein|tara:strand:+ start:163 stop:384 length:222 start_codon:yes stop_codon:yes gene_type:complete
MERLKLFIAWHKKLKEEGIRMYGEDQSDLAWYSKYNNFNCAIWAWHNSTELNLDGSYIYTYAKDNKSRKRNEK